MKITDDRYIRMTSGYKVLSTKAPSKHKGGIALLWQPDHEGFEVEAARVVTPNLITFQLVTGDERYYIMGIYIPPNKAGGGDDLRAAWEACPANCSPIVMGDLNKNVEHPRDEREATLANLLGCSFQKAWKRWTWRQKRRGRWIYSQPDYIMAREDRVARFRKVGFRSPPIHDSDHRAVSITCGKGEMGPSRPIDETANGSPSRSPPGSKTK
jgi:hypothetical protein